MDMFQSKERVIAFLQCAQDISIGMDSQLAPHHERYDFEPLPIGPNGIEQVVDEVPPLQWNETSELFKLFLSLNGAGISVLNNLTSQGLIHLTPNREQQHQQNKYVSPHTVNRQPMIGLFPISDSSINTQEKTVLPSSEMASVVSMASTEFVVEEGLDKRRFRSYQKGQWNERFRDLMSFRDEHGHLFVPHIYPPNQKLSQWVKR
jgi:hypothetical protein